MLKTLPPTLHRDEPEQRRLLLEEWFLRRVAGQPFPEVHNNHRRQHLYYAMRQYPGQTLAKRLKQGPLPLAAWHSLAEHLIQALGLLHRRNVIHRDIKPDNLLQGPANTVKVLDFGLAHCPGLSEVHTEQVAGTPGYIAPEAYEGAEPSPGHDIFAVGVVLYQALTGHLPHGVVDAFQRPRFAAPPPPSRYRPEVPEWLDSVLLKSLEPNPAHRYETAEHWLLVLQAGEQQPLERLSRPLLEREPLKVWRAVALASLLVNLVSVLVWLHG